MSSRPALSNGCGNFIQIIGQWTLSTREIWEVFPIVWHLPDTHSPAHLDSQHDVRLALQHLHGLAVADVVEPDTVGRQDLVPHFDAILLGQPTMIHSGVRQEAI